jgi:hypothetical protein
MHTARIFKLNSAGFLLFFLAACGSPQTPPANATGSNDDGGLLAAFAPDASVPDSSDADASTANAGATPINTTTTTTTDAPAPDPCNPATANFESQVRPKFNACYQEGKKKNPNLAGEIRITLSFDYKGKLTSTKVTGPDDLGKTVIACMLEAAKKTPFEFADACARKSIMVGKKFGEQKLTAPKGTITAD